MHDTSKKDTITRYLAAVREEAGLTQSQLAGRITYSPASISRIESGDKAITTDELNTILKAIGTPKARQLGEFTKQKWEVLERPDLITQTVKHCGLRTRPCGSSESCGTILRSRMCLYVK